METIVAQPIVTNGCAVTERQCNEWPLLSTDEIALRMAHFPLWVLVTEGEMGSTSVPKIERSFASKNFAAAMEFLQAVGVVAERRNHHPDLHVEGYRNVRVVIYTHSLGGLTDNDFDLARAIDLECPATYSAKWLKENSSRLTSI